MTPIMSRWWQAVRGAVSASLPALLHLCCCAAPPPFLHVYVCARPPLHYCHLLSIWSRRAQNVNNIQFVARLDLFFPFRRRVTTAALKHDVCATVCVENIQVITREKNGSFFTRELLQFPQCEIPKLYHLKLLVIRRSCAYGFLCQGWRWGRRFLLEFTRLIFAGFRDSSRSYFSWPRSLTSPFPGPLSQGDR